MVDDKKNEEQEKGFVVKDRRFSASKEAEGPSSIKEEKKEEALPGEDTSQKEIPLPEINFINFLFSLSTSAFIQLGEIEDPVSRKMTKNLPLAKQTIDLIGMLKEKTKGNLTPDEEKITENILYDLRMRYVKAMG
jgi:PBP1b-binding outer membrane lipoprotein LpoB